MRRNNGCQCCGFGLALSGFTGFPAACNFYSARVGSTVTTDQNGWLVCSVQTISMYSNSPVLSVHQTAISRFAYKVNKEVEQVEIELVLQVVSGVGQFGSFPLAEWTIAYHVPFEDFDRLIGEGRLALNEFVVSQSADGQLFYKTLDGLGQIVLVWPPFYEDWTGKQLTAQMEWAAPFVISTFDPTPPLKYELDFRFSGSPFVFVFDETTLQESQVLGRFLSFYQDEHVGIGGTCFPFYRAQHSNVLSGQEHVARLSFRSANLCDGRERRLRGNPSMFWAISGIWWKAFVGPPDPMGKQILQVVCDDRDHQRVSPLLNNSQFSQGQLTKALFEWEEAFPVTVTLTLENVDA